MELKKIEKPQDLWEKRGMAEYKLPHTSNVLRVKNTFKTNRKLKELCGWNFEIKMLDETSTRINEFIYLIESYIELQEEFDYKLVDSCLDALYKDKKIIFDSEAYREIKFKMRKFINVDGFTPSKIDIVYFWAKQQLPGIYPKDKVLSDLEKEFMDLGKSVTSRSIGALIERLGGYLYYFDKQNFVVIKEQNYQYSIELFKDHTIQLVNSLKIISTRLLIKDFQLFFPEAGNEAISEYFIHAFLKSKFKNDEILFARSPIITKKEENGLTIDYFWNEITNVEASEPIQYNDLLKVFEEKYGFNPEYSRNILSMLNYKFGRISNEEGIIKLCR